MAANNSEVKVSARISVVSDADSEKNLKEHVFPVISGTVCKTIGFEPAVFQIIVAYEPELQKAGVYQFSPFCTVKIISCDDRGTEQEIVVLSKCKIRSYNRTGTPSKSPTAVLTIADNRWQWVFYSGRAAGELGEGVSGPVVMRFNQRDASGKIIGDKKAVRDIVKELIYQWRELPSTSDLNKADAFPEPRPNDDNFAYPHVDWEWEKPAKALAELCERYAVTVAVATSPSGLEYLKFYELGKGRSTANVTQSARLVMEGVEFADVPRKLKLIGERNRYQVAVRLTAVGIDIDDKIKLLTDAAGSNGLSFKPTAGWHPALAEELKDAGKLKESELFHRYCFRLYQLPETIQLGEVTNPNLPACSIGRYELEGRWFPELLEYTTSAGAEKVRAKAYITGKGLSPAALADPTLAETSAAARLKTSFRLLPRIGCVLLSTPMYDIEENTGNLVAPQELTLTSSFAGGWFSGTLEDLNNIIDGHPGNIEIVRREDCFYEITQAGYVDAEGHANPRTGQVSSSLKTEVEKRAKAYLDEAARKYRPEWRQRETPCREIPGLIAVEPDGLIHEVSWTCSINAAPVTIVSWNTEHYSQPRIERQINRKVAELTVENEPVINTNGSADEPGDDYGLE